MRQILGTARQLTFGGLFGVLAGLCLATPAQAQTATNSAFSLPGVTLPQGADEVRAADGTSCRSSNGGSGAYLDVGIIGSPNAASDNNAYYGRVVVPLGRNPKRLDCTKLYELEVERLRMELELMKAGLGRSSDPEVDNNETASVEPDAADEAMKPETVAAVKPAKTKKAAAKKSKADNSWADEGWSTEGRADAD